MKVILLTFLILCGIIRSIAQDHLVLTAKSGDKSLICEEGKRVYVVLGDTAKYRGRLKIVNKEMISVKDQVIPIQSITRFGFTPKGRFVIGSMVVLAGASGIFTGMTLALNKKGLALPGFGGLVLAYFCTLPTTAGLIILATQKQFDTKDKWTISVE